MYASQAWSGHVSAASIGRIDAFLRRMYRYGFSQSMYDFHNLSVTRDFTLYHQIIKPSHCLHCLLPCEKILSQCMSLRPRGHDSILPTCKYMNCLNLLLSTDVCIVVYNISSLNAFVV